MTQKEIPYNILINTPTKILFQVTQHKNSFETALRQLLTLLRKQDFITLQETLQGYNHRSDGQYRFFDFQYQGINATAWQKINNPEDKKTHLDDVWFYSRDNKAILSVSLIRTATNYQVDCYDPDGIEY